MKKNTLYILLLSGRWRLSIAAALASAVGALLAHPVVDIRLAAIFTGSTLFALAVTWFNQIQERRTDGLMSRTRNRPLANNRLPLNVVAEWAGLCLAASFLLLFVCGRWPAVAILGMVILFYNGIYTPLKRRSLSALILGAIAGAAPTVLGWICAEGKVTSVRPFILFLLFFFWQVPHFWLVAELNSIDYESAKIPLPWRYPGKIFYKHVLVLWVLAFCVTILALPAFGLVHSSGGRFLVLLLSALSISGLVFHALSRPGILARVINFSMAAICTLLVAEKLIGG